MRERNTNQLTCRSGTGAHTARLAEVEPTTTPPNIVVEITQEAIYGHGLISPCPDESVM